jgi:AcrR family transcriptional regulator
VLFLRRSPFDWLRRRKFITKRELSLNMNPRRGYGRAMAEQRTEETEDTRRRIVNGAFEVIDELGIHNLTLKAVAQQSGVAISLISYHFGSKEKLLNSCAERWVEILTPLIEELFNVASADESLSEREVLERVLGLALETARTHPLPMRVMLRQLVATGDVPEAISEISLANLDGLESVLCQRFGVSSQAARAIGHQTAHLIIRMGISSPDELQAVYKTNAEEAWKLCKHYVCATVHAALVANAEASQATST